MKLNVVAVAMFAALISGCGVNKAIVAQTAVGPKDLFVNLQGDPLLISIELRIGLESKGYRVDMNTEEAGKSVIQDTNNGSVVYKNASDSSYRYELLLSYQPIQDRIQQIAATVRDRQANKILGTYRWTWDRFLPAPTVEGAIELIDENLLSRVFK